jgi:IS5 family transposase
VIQSTASQDAHDEDPDSGAYNCGDQEDSTPEATGSQGSLLIDARYTPADIRYPTDLSLLNQAREVTEKLIDAKHPPVRDGFGAKPRTHRLKARQQFLAVAKKKRPPINMIRMVINQQLAHLERNLTSIDALIACGAGLLAAGRHWY